MNIRQALFSTLAGALVVCAALSQPAFATVSGFGPSNVDGYFGSANDSYQATTPTAPSSSWPAVGGSPAYGAALPNLPLVPAGNVAPTNLNPFAPSPASSPASFAFGTDSATFKIVGALGTSQTVDDAQINLFMSLIAVSSTYTEQQVNYSIDYTLTNSPNRAGFLSGALDAFVTRSYLVAGNVGSYVNFGGVMNFWDVTSPSTATSLGSLNFSYYNTSPGPFSAIVGNTGFIGVGGPPNSINAPDSLRITGDFYVIGDPSSITVTSLPEPSTIVLAALGLLGLCGTGIARRRKKGLLAAN